MSKGFKPFLDDDVVDLDDVEALVVLGVLVRLGDTGIPRNVFPFCPLGHLPRFLHDGREFIVVFIAGGSLDLVAPTLTWLELLDGQILELFAELRAVLWDVLRIELRANAS
jgi:hypothetical protein